MEVKDTAITYDFLTEDNERFIGITLAVKTMIISPDTFRLAQVIYTVDEALIDKIQSRNFSKVRIERMREYAAGCPEDPVNWKRNSHSPYTGSLFNSYLYTNPRDCDYEGNCPWTTIEFYRIVKVR